MQFKISTMHRLTIMIILFYFLQGCSSFELDLEAIEPSNIAEIFKQRGIEKPEDFPAIKNWTENCRSIVGENHWKRIVTLPQKTSDCLTKYIKIKKLENEIEDGSQRGELDLVFQKYCNRRTKIQKCINRVMKNIEPCFSEEQLGSLNLTKTAADAALDFICADDGNKIALFVSEQGVQCVSNRTERLKMCLKETIPRTEELEVDLKSIDIDDFMISKANCNRLFSAHDCIVNITTECADPTPSNIIDSLLKQALKVTPCARSGAYNPLRSYCYLMLVLPYLLTLVIAGLTAAHILL